MDNESKNALAKIQLSLKVSYLLENPSVYIKDSYTDEEIINIFDYLLRHGIPCLSPAQLPADPVQRLQVMQMMARAWISHEVLNAICFVFGSPRTFTLPGELVKCTYEGLPLEFEEWDDLYVVGDIPVGIWDKIRDKHTEYMKNNPGDWQVDELAEITKQMLEDASLRVYTFQKSCEFPARKNILCDQCRCEIPEEDKIVRSESTGDATFCSASCLYDALTQKCEKVRIVKTNLNDPGNALLECPHCHKQSYAQSDRWYAECVFYPNGSLAFSIATCPYCGGISALSDRNPERTPAKPVETFTSEKPVNITETGFVASSHPPKKGGHFDPEAVGHFEYICPVCQRAWKDNDPDLPRDLFCAVHTFVPLVKRFSAPQEGGKHE